MNATNAKEKYEDQASGWLFSSPEFDGDYRTAHRVEEKSGTKRGQLSKA
jgi:hypothetical protein